MRLFVLYGSVSALFSALLFILAQTAAVILLVMLFILSICAAMVQCETMDCVAGKVVSHDGVMGRVKYEDGTEETLYIAPCDVVYRFEDRFLCFHISEYRIMRP